MEIVLAFVIGGLYAAAVYMLLRRSLVKMLIGLALLSHAANLLIFTVGRLTPGRPPIISLGAEDLAAMREAWALGGTDWATRANGSPSRVKGCKRRMGQGSSERRPRGMGKDPWGGRPEQFLTT